MSCKPAPRVGRLTKRRIADRAVSVVRQTVGARSCENGTQKSHCVAGKFDKFLLTAFEHVFFVFAVALSDAGAHNIYGSFHTLRRRLCLRCCVELQRQTTSAIATCACASNADAARRRKKRII